MKKRVLLINDSNEGGGAESIFRNHVIFLTQSGNYEVYTAYCGHNAFTEFVKYHLRLFDSKNSITKVIDYLFNFRNFALLLKFLLKIKPEIIHLHNFYAKISPSLLAAIFIYKLFLKGSQKSIKVLQTVHDYSLICPNSSCYDYNKNRLCKECVSKSLKFAIIKNRCYHGSFVYSLQKFLRTFISINVFRHKNIVDRFICPSNFIKELLREEGIPPEKLVVIPNPIDLNIVKFSEHNYRKQNIVSYVGRLSYEKGINFLLDIWKRLSLKHKNWYLYIIGDGPMREALELRSKSVDNVVFTGWLNSKEVYDILSRSKIFVLPSIWFENLPTVVLEAILSQNVVLVRNIGGMEELALEYENIVAFSNEDDLTDKLEKLMLEMNSIEYMSNHFSSDLNKIILKHGQESFLYEIGKIYS